MGEKWLMILNLQVEKEGQDFKLDQIECQSYIKYKREKKSFDLYILHFFHLSDIALLV